MYKDYGAYVLKYKFAFSLSLSLEVGQHTVVVTSIRSVSTNFICGEIS